MVDSNNFEIRYSLRPVTSYLSGCVLSGGRYLQTFTNMTS